MCAVDAHRIVGGWLEDGWTEIAATLPIAALVRVSVFGGRIQPFIWHCLAHVFDLYHQHSSKHSPKKNTAPKGRIQVFRMRRRGLNARLTGQSQTVFCDKTFDNAPSTIGSSITVNVKPSRPLSKCDHVLVLIVNHTLVFVESELDLLQNLLDGFGHVGMLVATHAPEVVAAGLRLRGDPVETTQMKAAAVRIVDRALAGFDGSRPNR